MQNSIIFKQVCLVTEQYYCAGENRQPGLIKSISL